MTKPPFYDAPVNVLARAVAKEYHGIINNSRDGELFEGMARLDCDGPKNHHAHNFQLTLDLRGYGAKKNTLTVRLHHSGYLPDVDFSRLLGQPCAGINMERGEAVVLKEIGRRVIHAETAAPYLGEIAKRSAIVAERRANLAESVARVKREFPGLSVGNRYSATSSHDATFYNSAGFASYCTIRVYPEGQVIFDRIEALPWEKARRVLAILAEA